MRYRNQSIIGLILVIAINCNAQNGVGFGYYSTHTGRNIAVTYNQILKNHTLYLGIKYHVNRTPVDNQNHVFYKRLHASNFQEHFGLVFGYYFLVGNTSKKFNPLLFADIQFLRATLRRFGFGSKLLPGGGTRSIIKMNETLGSATAFENSLGIGFRTRITNQLHLIERFGLNINVFTRLPDQYFLAKSKSEFGVLLAVGLIWQI